MKGDKDPDSPVVPRRRLRLFASNTLPTATNTEAAMTRARYNQKPGRPSPPNGHLLSVRAASFRRSITASWTGAQAAAFLGELRDLVEPPELALRAL
jgi:hypothetical protein